MAKQPAKTKDEAPLRSRVATAKQDDVSAIPTWSEKTAALNDLRLKFVELEYGYLTQSSFHTDELRNKFIEFYLLNVGAAGSVMLGLAQLGTRVPHWVYASAAFFLGILGMVMLPIFARLRRVVLECLQGTALSKRYVEEVINAGEDKKFSSALLWDASTLPTDESYLTASEETSKTSLPGRIHL